MADEHEARQHGGLFHRLHQRFFGGGDENQGRFEAKATAESHFSWLRTRMSMERTLMSWVRTSTALIAFGFTIFQFFEKFHAEMEARHRAIVQPEMSRYMGLALIAAGVLSLMVAMWQYRAFGRYLWSKDFAVLAGVAKVPIETPIFVVAICLLLIGLYAFLAVLIRAV